MPLFTRSCRPLADARYPLDMFPPNPSRISTPFEYIGAVSQMFWATLLNSRFEIRAATIMKAVRHMAHAKQLVADDPKGVLVLQGVSSAGSQVIASEGHKAERRGAATSAARVRLTCTAHNIET